MTTVETIGRIRRAYFVQKVSVREIARRLQVSRKTVRRAIEAEDGKFSYDRAVQPMPNLGAYVADRCIRPAGTALRRGSVDVNS